MNSTQPLKTYSPLEILERTFSIYRDNLLPSILIAAAVSIPISIINFILSISSLQKLSSVNALDPNSLSGVDFNTVCFSSLITSVLIIIQFVLINGPISYMASESILGRKVTLIEALRARQARFTTLGWGLVQFYLAMGAFAVAVVGVSSICAPILAFLGALIYFGMAIYGLLTPVMILENGTVTFSVSRAWTLGKSRFWTVAGLTVAVTLISTIIGWAVLTVLDLVLAQQINAASALAQDAINTAISTAANIFLLPLLPIAMTLLYYDTRLRQEGLADALQTSNNPDAHPWDIASPPPQGRLLPNDLRNMVIVMVVTLALAVAAGAYLAPVINDMLAPGLSIR